MPGLVREMGIGRHTIHFDAHRLEGVVVVGQIAQFGRAHECEVGRIEHDDRPFAFQVGVRNVDKFAIVESGGFEWLDLCIDQGHSVFSVGLNKIGMTE